MRHPRFQMPMTRAIQLLESAPVIHLATTDPQGMPVLRALNAVVVDGYIAFHGAPVGEKAEGAGRPAVITAERVIAAIPSYFIDPERACPATTFYESAQVHGTLEVLEDASLKARILQALMEKYQPEGGYRTIDADSHLYRRAIAGLLVMGIRLERVTGKAKLGQNRTPEEIGRVIEGLWRRGHEGDPAAIRRVLEENPRVTRPQFLQGPRGSVLEPALGEREMAAVTELLRETYWNRGVSLQVIERAHRNSAAWVGARDDRGELIATARAVTDRAKFAYIADVAVAAAWRARGVGSALMQLLLDHPALRAVRVVRLGTADARGFYERLGFVSEAEVDFGFPVERLTLVRPADGASPSPAPRNDRS